MGQRSKVTHTITIPDEELIRLINAELAKDGYKVKEVSPETWEDWSAKRHRFSLTCELVRLDGQE